MKAKDTFLKSYRRLIRGQKGFLLMEVVVSLAVFGILGTAVLSSVQTSYISKNKFNSDSTAENIIRNQLESVIKDPYKNPGLNYDAITAPSGYSVTAEALTYDATSTDIETVRITVYQDGQAIKVFETVRTNR